MCRPNFKISTVNISGSLPNFAVILDDSEMVEPIIFNSSSSFQVETRSVRQWNSEQDLKYRLPDELWILVDKFLLDNYHRDLKKVWELKYSIPTSYTWYYSHFGRVKCFWFKSRHSHLKVY